MLRTTVPPSLELTWPSPNPNRQEDLHPNGQNTDLGNTVLFSPSTNETAHSNHPTYKTTRKGSWELFFDQAKHPGCLTISPVSQVSRSQPVAFTAQNNCTILGAEKGGDACYMQRVALKLLM